MVYGPQNGRRSKDSRSIVFSSKFIRIVSEIVNFILLSPVTVNLNSKCQIEEREQLLDMCYIILAYGVFPNVRHVFIRFLGKMSAYAQYTNLIFGALKDTGNIFHCGKNA